MKIQAKIVYEKEDRIEVEFYRKGKWVGVVILTPDLLRIEAHEGWNNFDLNEK